MRSAFLAFMLAIFSPCAVALQSAVLSAEEPLYVTYEGKEGPGKGKHVVLVSGDEEYRSEEALPQLGKILAQHHGFTCTVLFPVHPKTGEIDPGVTDNIPGLEHLAKADLMVIATRFRRLPEEQMKWIVEYLEAGKPVLGMRTATHAFNYPANSPFFKYSYNYKGDDFNQGFGRQVLGETWIAHHGSHKHESTRGVFAPGANEHPILRGIKDGEIWGPTDVYEVRLPLPEGSQPLVLGQVLKGMSTTDEPVAGRKNDPMMPVAWTKTYRNGRVFTTTMGAATDMVNSGVRRMLVNGVFWCVGLEEAIKPELDISLIGKFEPREYGFSGHAKGMKPADYR